MIDKLELSQLPFVDATPDAGQKRIPWIKNGECMEGASTKYGNQGSLNAAPLGIQKNVETLETNSLVTKDKLNDVIDDVNEINTALGLGTDANFVQQVAKNTSDITNLQISVTANGLDITALETDTRLLADNVGVYNAAEDSLFRTVRQNIVWIKTEMGNYTNQDINGRPLVSAIATGMKRRILDNTSELVLQRNRIVALETAFEDSDMGAVNAQLTAIRTELGVKPTGKPNIYTRLDGLDSADAAGTTAINELKTFVGFGSNPSISSKVSTLETTVAGLSTTVSDPTTGLVARTTKAETDISSLFVSVGTAQSEVNALEVVVGATASDGLRGDVASIKTDIGAKTSPAAGTINFRLNALTTLSNETASSVQNLQAEIGNNSSGIKGTTVKLTGQMEGTNPAGTTVAERGVLTVVAALEAKVASLEARVAALETP